MKQLVPLAYLQLGITWRMYGALSHNFHNCLKLIKFVHNVSILLWEAFIRVAWPCFCSTVLSSKTRKLAGREGLFICCQGMTWRIYVTPSHSFYNYLKCIKEGSWQPHIKYIEKKLVLPVSQHPIYQQSSPCYQNFLTVTLCYPSKVSLVGQLYVEKLEVQKSKIYIFFTCDRWHMTGDRWQVTGDRW